MDIYEELHQAYPEAELSLAVVGASYALGLGFAGVGRVSGLELLAAVPPAMDTFYGSRLSTGKVVCLAAYGAGVATAYTDKLIDLCF